MIKQSHLIAIQKNAFWKNIDVLMITTQTMKYLEAQRIKSMDHSVYSPDFSPCDLCSFPKIKEEFRRKNFQNMNGILCCCPRTRESS